jgi:hypothetical protein
MFKLISWKQLEKGYLIITPKVRPVAYSLSIIGYAQGLLHATLTNRAILQWRDALYEMECTWYFAVRKLDHLRDESRFSDSVSCLNSTRTWLGTSKEVGKLLEKNGLMLCEGNVVDATISSVPNPTTNDSCLRDREMYQTRKRK